ncbi:hypothetical protein BH09ACT6_BH09ACT6_08890 [soil metagenome]
MPATTCPRPRALDRGIEFPESAPNAPVWRPFGKLDGVRAWARSKSNPFLSPSALEPEAKYLVERCHAGFTQAGAGPGETEKPQLTQLTQLSQQLSTLATRFEMNLLAATNDLAVVIDAISELDDISELGEGEISAAAHAAAEHGTRSAECGMRNAECRARLWSRFAGTRFRDAILGVLSGSACRAVLVRPCLSGRHQQCRASHGARRHARHHPLHQRELHIGLSYDHDPCRSLGTGLNDASCPAGF